MVMKVGGAGMRIMMQRRSEMFFPAMFWTYLDEISVSDATLCRLSR